MTETPRTNSLRATIESGDAALGVLDNAYSPALVEFYGELGLDFVWLDLEHAGPSPTDAPSLEHLLRAAERTGVEALVRLPEADPALVRKALDAGARNLFVSRIETAEEVRRAVRAARFRYDGEPGDRGLASPRASRWGTAEDYVDVEDEEVVVGATIENRAAIDNLDEILDVPELGFVFAGPLDISVALGYPGEPTHPEVQDAVEKIETAAFDADVPLGGLAFGTDDAAEKIEKGYRILNLGSTTGALEQVVTGWLDEIDQ